MVKNEKSDKETKILRPKSKTEKEPLINPKNKPNKYAIIAGVVFGIICFIMIASMGLGPLYAFLALIISVLLSIFITKFDKKVGMIAIACAVVAFFIVPIIISNVISSQKAQRSREIAQAQEVCTNDGYKWDYLNSRCDETETEKSKEIQCEKDGDHWTGAKCITQDEYDKQQAEAAAKSAAEKQAQSDCSAKGYYWNSVYKRCYSDAEQEKAEAEAAEDKILEAQCKARGEGYKYYAGNNTCEAPKVSSTEMKTKIITTCASEYSYLGSGARSECEDEFSYLTSSEVEKIYNLIISGSSYVNALSKI